MMFLVFSNSNNRGPSYSDTLDRGLLDMFPVSTALSLSFTIVTACTCIYGPTRNTKMVNEIGVYAFVNIFYINCNYLCSMGVEVGVL